MNRRGFIGLFGAAVVWPFIARAQQGGKVYRIGFLANDRTIPTTAAGKGFLDGLGEGGFIEGKNIMIERRFTEGSEERASTFAAELVKLKVDLIVTSSPAATLAAKQATKQIPIVMVNVADPVTIGIVASLASPGGNITGLSTYPAPEITGKRLALLKEVAPSISRVAFLMGPDSPQEQEQWEMVEIAARSLDVTPQQILVRQVSEFESAFEQIGRERADSILAAYNALNLVHRKLIVDLAAANRLPAMFAFTESAEIGGLMAYGASRVDLFRRAAIYVGKILKGTRPADLPIEQPTKFELVINLKAAKALGLAVPPSLLARADEVIE